MLSTINSGLKRSINKAGIVRQVDAARACEAWQEVISGMFTKEVAERSHALRCKNGVMTVAVLSSVFAQEFKFKEDEIINAINKKMGADVVNKLRYEM
ncbi:MAG: DUF721 domain-containing protein [Candidatus Paceibacterota bacterium]|jgi:predicted nucleic acid-binding Zn ribbon protein